MPKPPPGSLPKESTKPTRPAQSNLKLSDGVYSWTDSGSAEGERVLLTPREHQKLLDQIAELKKQLAGKKGLPPSGCAIRGQIEKRGESTVAVLKLTYTFRTASANVAVSLGGRRAFLVAASLDGKKLPVLETVEDGYAVLIEAAGDHTVVLEVECPISGRGMKQEIGFEIGLPRAAITTLIFAPPGNVPRLTLTTRAPDPSQPGKPPELRRIAGLDAKALLPPKPTRDPYPLGPVELLEVSWEPTASAPAVDATQRAELEVNSLLAEGFVETTAKVRLRGSSRFWRIAAPADAIATVDRAPGASGEPGSSEAPTLTKPTDATKPIWTIAFPAGTLPADWVITLASRTTRAKRSEAQHKGPFPIGPLAVLDVPQQTGTVRITTAANTRLICKHGSELKQEVPLVPPADDETIAFFRLGGGASGKAYPASPLLVVEATPLLGKVVVHPVYKFTLTDAGWSVRGELRFTPIRTSVESISVELPGSWRGPEVSPPELVEVAPVKTAGQRQLLSVRLTSDHKQPFDLVFTATVPVAPTLREASISLPRFLSAIERDTSVTASTPEGFEVHGTGREWDGDQPAAWGHALATAMGADGLPPKTATTATGKFERGLARLDLNWTPYRPPLSAEVQAEVAIHDTQIVVSEQVTLRSQEAFSKSIRFHGGAGVKALPPLDPLGVGSWSYAPPAEARQAVLHLKFVVPLPKLEQAGRKVPIALVLPAGATRIQTRVRVWMKSLTGRTVSADPGPWQEEPPEASEERDLLPALTLSGNGSDLPLVLELREASESAAASVWIERGLIQATVADDGISHRARFLLRRWLSDAVEVRLPESLATSAVEVYLGEPPRWANPKAIMIGGERILRVPLPRAKPGLTTILDLRYKMPRKGIDNIEYVSPRPIAAFAGPIRWHVVGPSGTVPLVMGGSHAEQKWRMRFGLVLPVPESSDELERWFQGHATGEGEGGSLESTVLRTANLDTARVFYVSRVNLLVGCSAVLLLIGLFLSRLPGSVAGPLAAVLASAAAVMAVIFPQPATQVAAAAEPGAALLVALIGIQIAARWYDRSRMTHLPGFARTQLDVFQTAAGSRPSDRQPPIKSSTGSARGAPPPQPVSTGS